MIKLVNKDIVPYIDASKECRLVAVGSYLATEKFSLRELDLIFGHYLGYYLKIIDEDIYPYKYSFDFISEFLYRHYQVKVETLTEVDPKKAWEILETDIHNNKVGITCVSIFYLNYHRNYKKVHHPHYLLILGYDTEDQTIIVNDIYCQYKGKLTFEEFVNGRNVKFGLYKNRYLQIVDQSVTKEIPDETFYKTFLTNVTNLQSSSSDKDVFQGICCIQKLKEWILSNKDRNLAYELTGYVEDFYQTALRHKKFLQLLIKDEKLIEIVQEITEEWKIILLILIKMKYKKTDKMILAIVNKLDTIKILLEKYLSILEKSKRLLGDSC